MVSALRESGVEVDGRSSEEAVAALYAETFPDDPEPDPEPEPEPLTVTFVGNGDDDPEQISLWGRVWPINVPVEVDVVPPKARGNSHFVIRGE